MKTPKVSFRDPTALPLPNIALVSAEYIAYAITYIHTFSTKGSHSKIAVIGWSQGTVDTQWALKYWPSTNALVTDFIAISPDFKGTYQQLICPGFHLKVPCAPGPAQQINSSEFLKTLRSGGGGSAIVPTTVVYSATDESVQPEDRGEGASSWMGDRNGVGAANIRVQDVCEGKGPGGGTYTHSSVLMHPVTWALVQDALKHDGPGDIKRIDLEAECRNIAAAGLSVEDVQDTVMLLVSAFVQIVMYPGKGFSEPEIKGYAR